jgi:rubredoxin
MKSLVRCKSCGFILEEGKLHDVCPACGVPRKMFEPYTETISEKRLRILQADLHPIAVHLPQAYCFTLLPLALLALAIPTWLTLLADAIRVLAWGLPFVLVLTILSGMLDGKVRFRRLSTPILKQKIILGWLFFFCSLGMLTVVLQPSWPQGHGLVLIAILTACCLLCGTVLARLGTSLLNARFPG